MNVLRTRFAVSVVVACLLVGIFWAFQTAARQGNQQPNAASAVGAAASPTPTLKPAAQEYRDWLTALAIEETQAIERASQREAPTLDPNDWPTYTPGPSPTPNTLYLTPLPEGAALVDSAPMTHDPIMGTRPVWLKNQDTTRLVVYAGAERQRAQDGTPNTSQGIVIVREETTDHVPDTLSNDRYYTPQRSGPVRITNTTGMLLELTAEDGTMFWFDVTAREFVATN